VAAQFDIILVTVSSGEESRTKNLPEEAESSWSIVAATVEAIIEVAHPSP